MNALDDSLPRTGRIGRFVKILEKEVAKDVLLRIANGSEKFSSYSPSEKAEWWKDAISRMEQELGIEKTKEIMCLSGEKCCGLGHRKTVVKKFEASKSMEEFLEKITIKGVSYELMDKNTINAEYKRCFCGLVKGAKTVFPNLTYCECGTEFNRQYFAAALAKPVNVELVSSVINGSDCCKYIIHI
jgi:hypothetical protein